MERYGTKEEQEGAVVGDRVLWAEAYGSELTRGGAPKARFVAGHDRMWGPLLLSPVGGYVVGAYTSVVRGFVHALIVVIWTARYGVR